DDNDGSGITDTAKVTAVELEAPELEAPELPELTGENFWQTIEKGYWFIKRYAAPYGKASTTSISPLLPHPATPFPLSQKPTASA
ncbi:hypothetical protein RUND412_008331, partial [Rhizina undulata]